jgi:hypothetical protein
MNMVIPNEGKELLLYWALGTDGSDLEDFILRLYKNDYTPVDGSSGANFTVSDFDGYMDLPILRANFDPVAIVANVAEIEYDTVPEFVCTGGAAQNAYGWYLLGDTSGKVIAAQRFDSPRSMAPGATERLDPFKIKLKTFA